jgi:hypothetical protein
MGQYFLIFLRQDPAMSLNFTRSVIPGSFFGNFRFLILPSSSGVLPDTEETLTLSHFARVVFIFP